MNQQLRNELTEICMLSILRKKPVNGYTMLLEMDKYMGLENVVSEHCFSDLRIKGYCSLVFEEHRGEKQGVYYITPKGLRRLSDFLTLWKPITQIHRLLSEQP